MTPAGGEQTRLGTDVLSNSPWTPFLSRDGHWVTYTNLQQASLKIPVEGGAAAAVFDMPGGQPLPELPPQYHDPTLSPDGRLVMGHYRDEAARGERIVIMPTNDPAQVTHFPNAFVSAQWTVDGRSIVYIDNRRQMGNLWRQPIAGGPPVQLTKFDGLQIFRFAYTRDGRQLAVSRGATISDVVLMTSRDTSNQTR
jgi:Tol biopolymer transport system component